MNKLVKDASGGQIVACRKYLTMSANKSRVLFNKIRRGKDDPVTENDFKEGTRYLKYCLQVSLKKQKKLSKKEKSTSVKTPPKKKKFTELKSSKKKGRSKT
jgi:hypothetical protein